MARVIVRRKWPDGDILEIKAAVTESYPDAVDEAATNVLRVYAEALGITLRSDVSSDEADE